MEGSTTPAQKDKFKKYFFLLYYEKYIFNRLES